MMGFLFFCTLGRILSFNLMLNFKHEYYYTANSTKR